MNKRRKIKVGISVMPPFVMESNGKYSGFEIELWEMVVKELGGIAFEYEEFPFQVLIPQVAEKKLDIAFASITINEKREEVIDFSHPTFNSGLRILLSKNRKNVDFGSTIKLFFSQGYKQFLKPLLFLLISILVLGVLLFLIERNNGSLSSSFFPGIFQTTWVFLCSMLGLDGALFVYPVTSWLGRVIVACGQLLSLAFLGLFIGELSAFITTRKIRLNIEEPRDLTGKLVATVQDSTSELTLKNIGAVVKPVTVIKDAFTKLKNKQVEAVVFDAPVLDYYSLNEGSDWTEVVGKLFEKQDYGFVLQNDSPFRKEVNLAILTINENGTYDELYKKWFGNL